MTTHHNEGRTTTDYDDGRLCSHCSCRSCDGWCDGGFDAWLKALRRRWPFPDDWDPTIHTAGRQVILSFDTEIEAKNSYFTIVKMKQVR